MIIIAISGKAKQGKTTIATMLPMHFKDKRCKVISYYDSLNALYPKYNIKEKNSLINIVSKINNTFFTDYIEVYMAIWNDTMDILIIDDIDDTNYMSQLKTQLGAILLGIEKDYPYIIPYSIRDDMPRGTLGEPDFVLKNPMTINRLHANIEEFIKYIMNRDDTN